MDEQKTCVIDGQWAVVELFGHRRLAGQIREVTLAGAPFLRIDVYAGEAAEPILTEFKNAQGAIYGVIPVTEEICRRFAMGQEPRPIRAYELPALDKSRPLGPEQQYYADPAEGAIADEDLDGDEEPDDTAF